MRDELTKQRSEIERRLGVLAYNRLAAVRQIEQADKDIENLEAQYTAFGTALSTLATDEAVSAAKENDHA
jgi:hypothetical protein